MIESALPGGAAALGKTPGRQTLTFSARPRPAPALFAGAIMRPVIGMRGLLAITFASMAGLVALTLGLLFADWSAYQARLDQGSGLTTLAHSYVEQLNREMATRSGEIAVLARVLQALDPRNPLAARALLDGMQHEFPAYSWIGMADLHGRVVASTGGVLAGADVSARPWFQAGQAGPAAGDVHDAVLLARLLSPPGAEPLRFVDVSVPIRNEDGVLTGVLGAHFDWRWAQAVDRAVSIPLAGRDMVDLLVVSREGVVLYGPADVLGTRLDLPEVMQARTDLPEATVERWPDGKDYLTAAAFGRNTGMRGSLGWTAVARQPLVVVEARVRQVRWTVLAAGVACALLFATVGWVLASRIAAPIRRMAHAAEHLRLGEAVEMPRVQRPREVGVLSTSINALLATLTHKQKALDVMQEVARHDPLTGLLNRAGMSASLADMLRRARRDETTLSLLCVDLDGFKAVNDGHGHAVGDLLLQEVAARLSACVRTGDLVARLGGDEFVLVLETGPAPAHLPAAVVTERVLASVAAPYPIAGEDLNVGCSVGRTYWRFDTEPVEAAFRRADDALYAAKRAGRGCAVVYAPELVA